MQLCTDHWAKLKGAISERGLDKYVSKSGEQAIEAAEEGRPDPLLAATLAIFGNAMDWGGLELLTVNEDGSSKCPICFLKELALAQAACDCGDPECTPENRAAGFERWIQHAANEQLERLTGEAAKA